MRFVTFRRHGQSAPSLGVENDDASTYTDLSIYYPDEPACASLLALIESGDRGLGLASAARDRLMPAAMVRRDSAVLLPPLVPSRLRDTGMIRTHLRPCLAAMSRWIKANTDDDRTFEEILVSLTGLFSQSDGVRHVERDRTQLTAPGEVVRWPAISAWLDYELEVGVVIGRSGRDVSAADAADHIFGYTVFNDWSLRDVQVQNMLSGHGPHGSAKDFPGSTTIGPCVVTKDEIRDPHDLTMTVRVNGETWGTGSTNQMWCSFEDAVVSLSRDGEIRAGEVWGTGTTRDGSAFELGRRVPLPAYVELEVERVGVLANYVLPAA